jgi:cation:H+ antiporter
VIVVWLVVLVAGLAGAAYGSRRAVTAALDASSTSNIPPGIIGLTVMAVGTDLPEIANSIVAAFGGHGDLIVGDAAGSALTQVTLILGLLCLGSTAIHADRQTVLTIGTLTTAALLAAAVLSRNGVIARWEGALLVTAWVLSIIVVQRRQPPSTPVPLSPVTPSPMPPSPSTAPTTDGSTGRHVAVALGWLLLVGLAATAVVESFIEISDRLGLPELIASAIVLSLGTSLPELVVDWTAIRRGAVALAIGDLFGSSLLDATLALGIGPALRAVTVSPTAATACLIAAMGVMAATVITGSRPSHGRSSATLLFLVYGAATAALIVGTG